MNNPCRHCRSKPQGWSLWIQSSAVRFLAVSGKSTNYDSVIDTHMDIAHILRSAPVIAACVLICGTSHMRRAGISQEEFIVVGVDLHLTSLSHQNGLCWVVQLSNRNRKCTSHSRCSKSLLGMYHEARYYP